MFQLNSGVKVSPFQYGTMVNVDKNLKKSLPLEEPNTTAKATSSGHYKTIRPIEKQGKVYKSSEKMTSDGVPYELTSDKRKLMYIICFW